jgi:hypothetical protein
LKLVPTSAKRGKASVDWQECVICQTKSPEKLYIFTDKSKLSFVQATEVPTTTIKLTTNQMNSKNGIQENV